jgi:hypothetical protein
VIHVEMAQMGTLSMLEGLSIRIGGAENQSWTSKNAAYPISCREPRELFLQFFLAG